MTVRLVVTVAGVVIYLQSRFGLTERGDKDADRDACLLGEQYARGAVEYYVKLLRINRILRERLG